MSMKRTFAILGSLLILAAAVGAEAQQSPAQEKNQVREKNEVRSGIPNGTETPLQNRLMFRDENGDGICDSFRDHDNDGIPNGQDPDWSGAKDGKGNQGRFGEEKSGNKFGTRNGQGGSNKWGKQSFRQSRAGGGNGVYGKGKNGSQSHLRKGGKQ